MLLLQGASLRQHNTFGFDVCAEYLARPANHDELGEALEWARQRDKEIFILGGGSNLVLTRNIPGLVIQQTHRDIAITGEDENSVNIYATAGVVWDRLVLYCIENGFYGIENLSLIPGHVGAAPMQNIGAYGVELADWLENVEVVDKQTGESSQLSVVDCELAYRDSIFKNRYKNRFVITAITLRLSKIRRFNLSYAALAKELGSKAGENLDLKLVREIVCRIRREKLPDPAQLGNAGSFFKNPIIDPEQLIQLRSRYPAIPSHGLSDGRYKIPAAWIVEMAGWKGYSENNVGVHRNQSIVLVNYGAATGEDILNLAAKVQSDIAKKFSIDLEMEPVVV